MNDEFTEEYNPDQKQDLSYSLNPWAEANNSYIYPESTQHDTPYESSPGSSSSSKTRLVERKFVGASLLTDYIIERKLGEGTFGEVYKARHVATQEIVALKKIIKHNEDEGVPLTALRELRILKKLNHENLLSLLDMAYVRGDQTSTRSILYMVMPYMDHDLSGLIDNPNIQFTIPQIKCYLKQLLQGIRYLHENDILHRDIKVANLLVDNKGILKIADFGLSRYVAGVDDLTNTVVTRWYRPPEVLLGDKNYTSSIDMWGIGCVFAQMLCGEPLIPGKDDINQLDLVFKLCGGPTDESMPGWRSLPGSDSVATGYLNYPRIHERFRDYDESTVDLLEKFFKLDPAKRISAKEALDHPLFSMAPLPAHHSCLPIYPSSHELDHFGSRGERKRQPIEPYRRPQPKASPATRKNGISQPQYSSREDSRMDNHSQGQRPDNRNQRPSGRHGSRDKAPRHSGSRGGPDNRNPQRKQSHKDNLRQRKSGGHTRHRY